MQTIKSLSKSSIQTRSRDHRTIEDINAQDNYMGSLHTKHGSYYLPVCASLLAYMFILIFTDKKLSVPPGPKTNLPFYRGKCATNIKVTEFHHVEL